MEQKPVAGFQRRTYTTNPKKRREKKENPDQKSNKIPRGTPGRGGGGGETKYIKNRMGRRGPIKRPKRGGNDTESPEKRGKVKGNGKGEGKKVFKELLQRRMTGTGVKEDPGSKHNAKPPGS